MSQLILSSILLKTVCLSIIVKLQPRTELLGTLKETAPTGTIFKVRCHYLFFEIPLPRKSMLTDWCESQWFEINIDLGVGRGRKRQSSFSSKTVKCPKSFDQGCIIFDIQCKLFK